MNQTTTPSLVAIVPAAGIGSRMQSEQVKQYIPIQQHTLLEYTLTRLLSHPAITHIIVALHPDDRQFNQLAIAKECRITTIIGGKSRAESVLAGLEYAEQLQPEWALVHDAARPCLSFADLDKLITQAYSSASGAILATPVSDTLKQSMVDRSNSAKTVDRAGLWQALTPQMFPFNLLITCLKQALRDGVTVTDEASALEYCHYNPLLIQGRRDNIKITYPEDLLFAKYYLTNSDFS